jgi:hypothetical protein
MNCYDCQSTDQATPAVAICCICGAGVCLEHADTSPQILHRPNGMGVATKPRAARRLLCATCVAAERSG